MKIFGDWPIREIQRLTPGESVWVFGTGSFGRAVARACVAQGIHVKGFVQTKPSSAQLDHLQVCAWGELTQADRAMPLLVAIFNRDTPFDGLVELARNACCQNIVLPWDLYAQFGGELGWRYWLSAPTFLRSHAEDLNRCHDRLADDASRECLRRLVSFRLGIDLTYAGFTHDEPQYFNNLTLPFLPNKSIRYLDGGAYNGDSFRQLLLSKQVSQAWLFEPDPENYRQLVQTVQENALPGLCLPLAVADGYRQLRFSSGLGEAGHLSDQGDGGITCVAIDDLLAGQSVDFIKLDVEGAEAAALRGAAKTLKKHRPVLALSCYHHPGDLWALADLLEELVPGYDLYFRQHTSNSFDLVLYAIPR